MKRTKVTVAHFRALERTIRQLVDARRGKVLVREHDLHALRRALRQAAGICPQGEVQESLRDVVARLTAGLP